MHHLRRFIQYLAFVVGLLCLANWIVDVVRAIAEGYGAYFFLLVPLVIGGVLALITARAAVSREWQKGPAVIIAVAYLASHFREVRFLTTRMPEVDSWWDVAGGLVVELASNLLVFAITCIVYRSSDRTLRQIGNFLTRRFTRSAPASSLRTEH